MISLYCSVSIWEIAVGVIADGDIVSAQAGQILDHDGGHIAHVDVVQHGLEAGAVEVRAGIAVVPINA